MRRRRRRRTPKEWRREERTGDGAAQRPRSFSTLDTFLHMIEPMKSRGRLTRFGHCGNQVAVS